MFCGQRRAGVHRQWRTQRVRMGRWAEEVALCVSFNADSILGNFPQGDLVREEPLVSRLTVRRIGCEVGARRGRPGRGAQHRRKQVFGRRLQMMIGGIVRQRLLFTARGLRIVEVVTRSRVAGFSNPNTSERAVTGGGEAKREAGAEYKGAEHKHQRRSQGRSRARPCALRGGAQGRKAVVSFCRSWRRL